MGLEMGLEIRLEMGSEVGSEDVGRRGGRSKRVGGIESIARRDVGRGKGRDISGGIMMRRRMRNRMRNRRFCGRMCIIGEYCWVNLGCVCV